MCTPIKPNIPGFAMGALLGKGQWAYVYEAVHQASRTTFACKTLHRQALQDPRVRQRFWREACVPSASLHPNVLAILWAGESNGCPYLMMPYCVGGNLEEERQRRGGRLSVVEAYRLLKPAMEGLAALHVRGFVHRDIKPQNILLDGRGISMLADFGLAKSIADAGLSGITSSSALGIGSLGFMPREQVANFRYVGAATDVWASAATYYYLVTGYFPRPGRPHTQDIAGILHYAAVPLRYRDSQISRRIAYVIDRALLDDVGARYANAGQFIEALGKALA